MTRTLAALTLVAAIGTQAPARGPKETVKLVVNGPGLRNDVEITDPAAIAGNVFAGNFMTTTATEPDKVWPRYRVAFYLNKNQRGVVVAYAVSYVRNPKSGEGFVYLPGHGEVDYGLNISTIMRDGTESPGVQPARDGAWRYGDVTWSAAVNAYLPRP